MDQERDRQSGGRRGALRTGRAADGEAPFPVQGAALTIIAHGVLLIMLLNLPIVAAQEEPDQIFILAAVIYAACSIAAGRAFLAAGDPVARPLTQCACHGAAAAVSLLAGVQLLAIISAALAVRRFAEARNAT